MRSGGNAAHLARGSAGVYLVKISSGALIFATQVVLARLLGVESFGTYALAYAWLTLILIVGRQGFDVASVRYIAAYRGSAEWGLLRGFIRFSRVTVFGTSTAAAALFAFAAWLFRSAYSTETLYAFWFAAATAPVFAFAQIHEAMLRGLKCVVSGVVFQALLQPAIVMLAFPVAVLWFNANAGAETAMAVYFAASVVSLVCVMVLLRRKLADRTLLAQAEFKRRAWLGASAAMMLFMSFGPIRNQVSVIILGALDGNATAGLYSAAVRITNLLQVFILAVNAAFAPMAADLHARGKHAELQRLTSISVRISLAGVLAAAIFVFVFGQWILSLLGPGFVVAYPILVILLGGQLLFAMVAPAGILMNMTGHQNDSATILVVSAAVNIILCLALVPYFGAEGAAAATAVTTGICSGLMALVAFRRLDIIAVFTLRNVRMPRGTLAE